MQEVVGEWGALVGKLQTAISRTETALVLWNRLDERKKGLEDWIRQFYPQILTHYSFQQEEQGEGGDGGGVVLISKVWVQYFKIYRGGAGLL